jgi:hypothetical protein
MQTEHTMHVLKSQSVLTAETTKIYDINKTSGNIWSRIFDTE